MDLVCFGLSPGYFLAPSVCMVCNPDILSVWFFWYLLDISALYASGIFFA